MQPPWAAHRFKGFLMSASLSRRGLVLAGLAVLTASCADSEGQSRAAFVTFLKERVLQPRGLRIPRLTEDEKRRFSVYAGHYAPIRAYHDTLTRDVAPLMSNAARVLPALRRPQDWTQRRPDIAESRKLIGSARTRAGDLLAATQTIVDRLVQPDDLRAVYAEAYRKTVTDVAPLFAATLDGLDELFEAVDQAGAYIDANLGRMRLVGGMFETSDSSVLSGLQERSSAIAGAQARLFEVRRRLDSLMASG
jgi:hypothetical protein